MQQMTVSQQPMPSFKPFCSNLCHRLTYKIPHDNYSYKRQPMARLRSLSSPCVQGQALRSTPPTTLPRLETRSSQPQAVHQTGPPAMQQRREIVSLASLNSPRRPPGSINPSSSVSMNHSRRVFKNGSFTATIHNAPAPASVPKPVLIASPTEKGEYSVVVFFHGFHLHNGYYSELFKHVASHGYVVVAPQLGPKNEIKEGCDVLSRLSSQGLQSCLPTNVKANTLNVALAGHSRGGRAAFHIALGEAANATPISIKLLIGIDPVAGPSPNEQLQPPILTKKPPSFDLQGIPAVVIGTGLGPEKKNFLFPACAPSGVNHQQFYNECQPPCFHLVAADYGHMDILDDPTEMLQKCLHFICPCGENTEAMRKFVGGTIVAFLKAYLDDNQTDSEPLRAFLSEPSIAPVNVDPVEIRTKEEANKGKVKG